MDTPTPASRHLGAKTPGRRRTPIGVTAILAMLVSLFASAGIAATPAAAVGAPEVVSIGESGTPYSVTGPQVSGWGGGVAVSGDGNRVVFAEYRAADLPCDKGAQPSCAPGVWMRDRVAGTTIEVSTDAAGSSLPADRTDPMARVLDLSEDGTVALFWLRVDTGQDRLYVKDLTTGDLELVTTYGSLVTIQPKLTGDGNTVFHFTDDGSYSAWDRNLGANTPVASGLPTPLGEWIVDVSDDGTKVLWEYYIYDEDGWPNTQLALLDRTTGTSAIVSNSLGGTPSSGRGIDLSGNGRYVIYSWERFTIPPQGEARVHDLETGQVVLLPGAGVSGTADAGTSMLGDDGRFYRYFSRSDATGNPAIAVIEPFAGTASTIDLPPTPAGHSASGYALSEDISTVVYTQSDTASPDATSPSPRQVMAIDLDAAPPVCEVSFPGAESGVSGSRVAPTGPSWGPFQTAGCWTQVSAGVWRAEGMISMNGLDIETTTAGGSITFDTTTGRISSSGVVKVSMRSVSVGGYTVGPFELAQEVIDWELDAADVPLTLSARTFGLPVSAAATVSAPEPGALRIQFDSVLPDLLGGGTVKADVRTTLASGLDVDTLQMTVSGAGLGRLAALDELSYRYDAEKSSWRLSGDVADGAGGGSFDGIVVWAENGALTSADLHVVDAHLAGLVHVEDLRVTYGAATGWQGHLAADGGPGGPAVDASFTYASGALQAAQVHAERVDLAGLVRVDTFDLTWDKTTATWKASGNATVTDVVPTGPDGAKSTTLNASLTVTGGVVADAHLRVADATIGGAVRVNHLDIDYDLMDGKPHWVGDADVVLPGPSRPRITAAVETLGGQLVQAHADGTALGLPLGPGVTLTDASLDVTSTPVWRIAGTATVTAGPSVAGPAPALSIDGAASATFTDPSLWELSGSLRVATVELATASMRYRSDGRLDADGHLDWNVGPVGVDSTIKGWATPAAFELEGDASVTVFGRSLDGRAIASSVGMAGCATAFDSSVLTVGAGVVWGTNEIRTLDRTCDLGPWRPPTPAPPVRGAVVAASAEAATTFALAGGEPAVALRIGGDGGVPQVIIAGPDGTTIDTTAPSTEHHLVAHDADASAALVVIETPAAGTWTVTAQPSSPAVTGIEQADALPAAAVAGTVVDQGDGTAQLDWTLTPQPGQQVTFAEILPDGTGAPITTTDAATGDVAFTSAPGPATDRRVVATVVQDGLPRATLELGTYTASVAPPPASPVDVAATRTGPTTATVTWGAPGGSIAGYEILSLPAGTITTAAPDANSADIGGLDAGDHTVWVRSLTANGPSPWSNPAPVQDGLPSCDADAFTDVDDNHPFCDDITWLVRAGVTTGYPDGTFRPGIAVTRQGIAAFLYRLTGQEHTGACAGTPFPDVPSTHPFCHEIAWMAAEGISTGYSDGTFRPSATITRQSMAAYLYRLAGQTATGPCTTDFPDVGPTHPFCHAIAWMVAEGITTGYADGTFRPGVPVTRQSAAAFLHRSEALLPTG